MFSSRFPVAHRTPQEIFGEVLRHARNPSNYSFSEKEQRKALRKFSLVCLYWARFCRGELFAHISLRSADDLKRYCALLPSTPPSLLPIVQHVRSINCDVNPAEEPWLHLVQPNILAAYGCLPNEGHIRFDVDYRCKNAGHVTDALRPLHPALPRSLPSHYSPVTSLVLSRVHFRTGADLCRLLATLRKLTVLWLEDITWATEPDLDTFRLHNLGAGGKLYFIGVRGAFDAKASPRPVWLLPAVLAHYACKARTGKLPRRRTARPPDMPYPHHAHDVLLQLGVTLLTISSKALSDPTAEVARFESRCDLEQGTWALVLEREPDNPSRLFDLECFVQSRSPEHRIVNREPSNAVNVHKVALLLKPEIQHQEPFVDAAVWETFCSQIRSLLKLTILDLKVENEDLFVLLTGDCREYFRGVAERVDVYSDTKKITLHRNATSANQQDQEWERDNRNSEWREVRTDRDNGTEKPMDI